MKTRKISEVYCLECKDPANGKGNKVILTINFRNNSYDMLNVKVSENSDIVQKAALFAQDVLHSTPEPLPKEFAEPTKVN